MDKILVTGGAGYIGSHTCVELLGAGSAIVVVDNLRNSKEAVLERIRSISGKEFPFHRVDIRDSDALARVFEEHRFTSVIHFAGLKAVGESCALPLEYYDNNVGGTVSLCRVMERFGVGNLVFSSSATVYGDPRSVPIPEDAELKPTNPYGWSKLFVEKILRDLGASKPAWNIALLRYFNPVGAHFSGRIGEDPNGIPNNLMPFITQVAIGTRSELSVFGNDYPTPDGTGIRDYIHVTDLAEGHLKALDALRRKPGVVTFNLGTGRGYSVMEVVAAFEKASGRKIPYKITPRRPGDIPACFSDPSKAEKELGWKARRGIEEMCVDSWRWQSKNPKGYL